MRDVNDDMDELFKKAAENYPLNTGSSDWNEVKKALQPGNETSPAATPKKNKSRRALWLLLLLLPFVFVIDKYAFNPVYKNASIVLKKSGKGLPEQKNSIGQYAPNQRLKNNLNNLPGVAPPAVKNMSPAKNNLNKTFLPAGKPTAKSSSLNYFTKNLPDAITVKSSKGISKNLDLTVNAGSNLTKEGIGKMSAGIVNAGSDYKNTEIDKGAAGVTGKDLNEDLTDNKEIKLLKEEKKNTALPTTDTLKKKVVKQADKTKNRQQHLYIGLVAGPDLTTIKLQKITKTGFNAGVVIGYTFNKRWGIETGFYLEKKYYYTEGRYFNTKKIPIPSTIEVLNANGSCKMIEVPLNIMYDFMLNQKANWFAVGGISSYFMKREDYGYLLSAYGQMPWEHEYSYKNSSKNWASIINLGVGYSRKIGKNGTFRLEPYIKVPVKGIGIGSLPVMSAGIDIGFTKNLF